jgi:hypothetical protein
MATGGSDPSIPCREGDGGPGCWTEPPLVYTWTADNRSDPGLPFGVASVADLSGRAFEVVDGEGTVLLSGVLPDLAAVDPLPWVGGSGGGVPTTANLPR